MPLADSVAEELWFGDEDPRHGQELASRSMAAALAEANALKPFPKPARLALRVMSSPQRDVMSLTRVIERDPAMSTRVLRVANSALFSPRDEVRSVRHAILVMGLDSLREVIVTIAVRGMFTDVDGVGRYVLDHCVGVAGILRAIQNRRGYAAIPSLYITGLLHDVGKLLLLQSREFDYPQLSTDQLIDPDLVHPVEREQLGFDHAVLGGHALRTWGMPEPIPVAVAWHHQPVRAFLAGGDVGTMAALLRVADAFEYEMRRSLRLRDETADALAAKQCFAWLGFDRVDIVRLWNDVLVEQQVMAEKVEARSARAQEATKRQEDRRYSWPLFRMC